MKKLIKYTTVPVLLLMVGFLTYPLLAHMNCDSMCCGVPSDYCTMESGSCCVEMSECDSQEILLVVSAPVNTVKIQLEISIDDLLQDEYLWNSDDGFSSSLYHYKFVYTQAHPGHTTPLLV
jgi:hypothetical protein